MTASTNTNTNTNTKKQQILDLFKPIDKENNKISCEYSHDIRKNYELFNIGWTKVFPEFDQRLEKIVAIYDEKNQLARIGSYLSTLTGGLVTYHETWREFYFSDITNTPEDFLDVFQTEIEQIREHLAAQEINNILAELKRLGPDGSQHSESEQSLICDELDNYLNLIDEPLRGWAILEFFQECMKGAKKMAVEGKNLQEILRISLDIDPGYYELTTAKINGRQKTWQYASFEDLKEDVESLKDRVKIDFIRIVNADIKIVNEDRRWERKPVFHGKLTFSGRIPPDLSEALPDAEEVLKCFIFEANLTHDCKSLNDFYKELGYKDDPEKAINDYEHCKSLLTFFKNHCEYLGLTFDDLLSIATADDEEE